MEKNMLKPNSIISKLPLWILRGTAVAVLSIAIFIGIAGYKIVPNAAQAQCVEVPQRTGAYINGSEDTYGAVGACTAGGGAAADTCDGQNSVGAFYTCLPNESRTCIDGVGGCLVGTQSQKRNVTCRALEVAGWIN